jgi:hypothetical protein
MPVITYSHDEYHALELVNASLRRQLDAAEALRPQWAQGHSTDSAAAQVKSVALQQVWSTLGVANQTECMQAIAMLLRPKGA